MRRRARQEQVSKVGKGEEAGEAAAATCVLGDLLYPSESWEGADQGWPGSGSCAQGPPGYVC